MSDLKARCLEAFPNWLKTLGSDVDTLAELLNQAELDDDTRRWVAGAINYLFKSLDLIPDGIEDLGFIDDAFVLRVAASKAPPQDALKPLADDAQLIEEFLAEDYERLERYVASLSQIAARGRTVDDVLSDVAVRDALVAEAKAWAQSYAAPTFARDEKNLVKLRAFLATKLPN